jgi:predicted transcriptional regulator
MTKATRLATLCGRSLGYIMISVGFMVFLGVLDFTDPWSGAWMMLLGLFLESSARQSWFQARAMDILAKYRAEDVMNAETPTVEQDVSLRQLATLGGRRFIFFVADEDEKVLGIVTEKEVEGRRPEVGGPLTAGEVMRSASEVPTAMPGDSGDNMLQRMETASVWHLPVISDGRLVGVVSKENLLRLLARNLIPTPPPPPRPAT